MSEPLDANPTVDEITPDALDAGLAAAFGPDSGPPLPVGASVLKALGASKTYIVRIILSETTLLCAAGVVGGIGLSFLMRSIFIKLFPTLTILISAPWILRAGLIAVLGGLLGAAYPAWLASRKDPVEALAYE